MVTTTAIGSYTTGQSQGSQTAAVQSTSSAKTAGTGATTGNGSGSTSATISSLARQLAASATRLDLLGRTLTRSQLSAKANGIVKDLTSQATPTQQAAHDAETPHTSDPDLLAKAKQATAFLAVSRTGTGTANNPFAGLSREQLYDVVFDDSGSYTFNERTAAFTALSDQENQWRNKVSSDATTEYKTTGKLTKFYTAVLDHYNSLPAIQKSLYPENYASTLKASIAASASGSGKTPDLGVLKDVMGTQTSGKTTMRQSSAAAKLAGLKLLQQAHGADASTTPTLPSQTTGGTSQNSRNLDSLLKSTYASGARSTMFNYFDS
jgi:hypothetical protein